MPTVIEDSETVVDGPILNGLSECCLGLVWVPAEAVCVEVAAHHGRMHQSDPRRLKSLLLGALTCRPTRWWRVDVDDRQVKGSRRMHRHRDAVGVVVWLGGAVGRGVDAVREVVPHQRHHAPLAPR